MVTAKINASQAHEFALAFVSDISDYIRAHEAEYLAYLARTGQVDDSYQPRNIETADFIVRKGE